MKLGKHLVLAGALALAACNPAAQLEDAGAQISDFQALYNEGDAQGFYRKSGPAFREAATAERLEGMIALVDSRLGSIRSSERAGFNTNFNNGTTTTTITMQTRFDRGEGTETYVFTGSGEDMELVGWTVNSPLLELSPEDMRKLTEDAGEGPPVERRSRNTHPRR